LEIFTQIVKGMDDIHK